MVPGRIEAIAGIVVAVMLPVAVGAQVTSWPSGRAGHVMAYDPVRGETLLLGGDTDHPPQTADSLWAWTGTEWRVHGLAGPGWRTLPAMAFDTRRGRLVVVGGRRLRAQRNYAEHAEGDTWEWDGARWEQRNVEGPGPIDHHAIVFDEARGTIVLQGGADGGRIRPGETWTYDGTQWRRADGDSGPGERVHHAMAYDSRRQRVVLFGGFGEAGDPPPLTWEWDGERWQSVDAPGPGARSRHRMAYDATHGVTVLYGGTDEPFTWTWDGERWQRAATEGPPPREMHAMAWDSRRGRVVLYGGGARRHDLWEWDGRRWEEVRPASSSAAAEGRR